jgi:hypothetical protein
VEGDARERRIPSSRPPPGNRYQDRRGSPLPLGEGQGEGRDLSGGGAAKPYLLGSGGSRPATRRCTIATASRQVLRRYGFGHADEFDLVLIEAVESGFIDKGRLLEEAAKLSEKMALADRTRSFSEAWDAFHNSLEDDADAVLDRIYESFKTDFQAITPSNLNGTIRLFKEFGREAQAKEMLELYVNEKVAESDFWDLMSSPLGDHVTDPEVREGFASKFNSIKPAFSPNEFLRALTAKNSWDREELAEMARLTPNDYVAIFKAAERKEISSVIGAALYFRNISNKDEYMTAMTSAAEAALRIIAGENPLNRMRMRKFGVVIDDPPAQGNPTVGDVPPTGETNI